MFYTWQLSKYILEVNHFQQRSKLPVDYSSPMEHLIEPNTVPTLSIIRAYSVQSWPSQSDEKRLTFQLRTTVKWKYRLDSTNLGTCGRKQMQKKRIKQLYQINQYMQQFIKQIIPNKQTINSKSGPKFIAFQLHLQNT